MLFLLLSFLSHANPIREGDILWSKKQYHQAVEQWKQAKSDPTQAISTMAQYRLLLVSTNILLPLDLIAADQEMAACDLDDPLCVLARVDREIIFRTLGFPHNQDLIIDLLSFLPDTLEEERNNRTCLLQTPDRCTRGPNHRGPGGPSFTIGFFLGQQIGFGARIGYSLPNVDREMGTLRVNLHVGTGNYGLAGFQYQRFRPFWIRTEADIRQINYFRFRENEWEQDA